MVMLLCRSFEFERSMLSAKASMLKYFHEYGLTWNDEERLQAYRSCELFSVIEEEEVGFLVLRVHDQKFYVADVQITEPYRNSGHGSNLLALVKAQARNRGFSSVWLRVFKCNPAFLLYQRNGFVVVCEEPCTYLMCANT